MSAWIETENGSLVKASIISIRQATGSPEWEVTVNAGPGPAVFAPALGDEQTAKRIRNALARHMDLAESADGSTCISFTSGAVPSVQSSSMED